MKILAVSDVEAKYYYDYYTPGKLDEFDLILACGDLRREYLEFLVTMARCPVLYVHGNHDDDFDRTPPEGCVCVDGRVYVYEGIRILGLGGSYRYRDGGHMYTEEQMRRRVRRLRWQLRRHKGFDILLTHAPARHVNDMDTLAHRGFACFGELIDRYRPRYFIHGHIHKSYGMEVPRQTAMGDTAVINAYDHFAFDYEEEG